jgi:hypothetical protein
LDSLIAGVPAVLGPGALGRTKTPLYNIKSDRRAARGIEDDV